MEDLVGNKSVCKILTYYLFKTKYVMLFSSSNSYIIKTYTI